MSEALLDQLCRESGLERTDVAFLAGFDDAQLADLIAACTHARDRRERDLGQAIDNGLTTVPFMLRGAVKKMIL